MLFRSRANPRISVLNESSRRREVVSRPASRLGDRITRWPPTTATPPRPPPVSKMAANTIRARALPLVTTRVQRPHRNLQVGSDLEWRCQTSRLWRRPSPFVLRATGIVTMRVAPSYDALLSSHPTTSRDPTDRFSSSPTRRVNFSSTSGPRSRIPTDLAQRKRPSEQGFWWWALEDLNL